MEEYNTHKGARDVQKQVENGDKVHDLANTSSVSNPVISTINTAFEHESLEEAVRVLNTHYNCQSTDDCVPGHNYSFPGLPRTQFQAHQVSAIWFILRRWVWDTDMPGALVANDMGLGQTFIPVAAEIICKSVTQKVVMGLPFSISWGNTLQEWGILA